MKLSLNRVINVVPTRRNVAYMLMGVLVAAGVATTAQTSTTSTSMNCDIGTAADFAIQSNLMMLNATTINPGKYFAPGGTDSCISSAMLQNFDLSNLIPDFASMISGAIDGAITSAINGAVSQVCNAANNALNGTVGNLNSAIGNINNMLNVDAKFANILSSELAFNTFGSSTYSGTGTYGASGSSGNAFGVTGYTGSGTGSSSGSTGNVSGNFNSSGSSGNNAATLAASMTQAQLNMDNAWGAYQGAQSSSGSGDYTGYLNAVAAYNSAVSAYNNAMAATTFGSGSNTFTPVPFATPNAPITYTGSFWGDVFNKH